MSVIVIAPVLRPVLVGVKVTFTMQLALLARLAGQLLVCAKSPLAVIAMLLTLPPLVFVTVTDLGVLVVPTSCLLNVREFTESVSGGGTPEPFTLTVCELLLAVSVIVSVADRVPIALGLKMMLKLQVVGAAVVRAARLEPQLFVCEKSPGLVPVKVLALIVIGIVEALVRVTGGAVLALPIGMLVGKLRLEAESVKFTMPVPLSETICGLPAALSVIVSAPVRAPMAVGVKLTLIVHWLPALTVTHLLVWRKSPLAATLEMLSAVA